MRTAKGGYTPVFRALGTGEKSKTWFRGPRLVGALAAFAVAVAATGWWWVLHRSAPVAIAVLPLTNLSQDPANDYFADGLTDEIIRNLSIIDGLAVRSQTSSFVFKNKPRNVREAGERTAIFFLVGGITFFIHRLVTWGRTEIRERGIFFMGMLLPWTRITEYSWADDGERLALQLHIKGSVFPPVTIPVRAEQKGAIGPILTRQLSEWPREAQVR